MLNKKEVGGWGLEGMVAVAGVLNGVKAVEGVEERVGKEREERESSCRIVERADWVARCVESLERISSKSGEGVKVR